MRMIYAASAARIGLFIAAFAASLALIEYGWLTYLVWGPMWTR